MSVKETRVIGPPGTGKTTWASRKIYDIVREHGSKSVIVASLTRAAAAEVVGRSLPIDRDQIGTLHSHAYHALGTPKLAQTPDAIEEWNAGNHSFPITPNSVVNFEQA